MAEIWFKLTYSLSGMHLRRSDEAPVSVPFPSGEGEITLWVRTVEKHPPQLCCDAVLLRRLKPDVAEMFKSLEAGILPQDSPPVVKLPHRISLDAEIDADGRIPEKWGIELAILPRKFQALSHEIKRQLSDYVHNFIKTLRWIQGASGGQSPFAFVQFQWSWDKASWHNMPHSIRVRITTPRGIDTSTQAIERIRAMWASEESEPLAHELVREARDIANTNPRSALLIGVSALETGLKGYIQSIVPNSHIIIDKMPSPPVITMLQEVIPSLHSALKVENSSFPLNNEDKEYVIKWVSQRNLVAHGLKQDINIDDLLVFIEFAQAMLYKLDVCGGREWAEPFAVFKTENH